MVQGHATVCFVLQVVEESDRQRAAEEARRQDAVKDMTEKLQGITERIDSQQSVMKAQQEDNERLRKQLSSVGNVVQLSEQMKEQYDGELAKLRKELLDQVSTRRMLCAMCSKLMQFRSRCAQAVAKGTAAGRRAAVPSAELRR
jgi:predicted RNase H-like nuclease (RuvC/YqgF family)